jgi:hypothetical protein
VTHSPVRYATINDVKNTLAPLYQHLVWLVGIATSHCYIALLQLLDKKLLFQQGTIGESV